MSEIESVVYRVDLRFQLFSWSWQMSKTFLQAICWKILEGRKQCQRTTQFDRVDDWDEISREILQGTNGHSTQLNLEANAWLSGLEAFFIRKRPKSAGITLERHRCIKVGSNKTSWERPANSAPPVRLIILIPWSLWCLENFWFF